MRGTFMSARQDITIIQFIFSFVSLTVECLLKEEFYGPGSVGDEILSARFDARSDVN